MVTEALDKSRNDLMPVLSLCYVVGSKPASKRVHVLQAQKEDISAKSYHSVFSVDVWTSWVATLRVSHCHHSSDLAIWAFGERHELPNEDETAKKNVFHVIYAYRGSNLS